MSSFFLTLALALVVGILTGGATALRSVSRIWLRHWAERRLAGAGTAALYLERPQRLLLAAGTGIAGTVFAMGAVIGLQVGDDFTLLVQHLLLGALLLLIVGQLVPRAAATTAAGSARASAWRPRAARAGRQSAATARPTAGAARAA